MTEKYTDAVIQGLAWLRSGWGGDNSVKAIEAFEALDNAGVFAALDEQTDYASAEDVLAEHTVRSGAADRLAVDEADLPAGYVPSADRLWTISYPQAH